MPTWMVAAVVASPVMWRPQVAVAAVVAAVVTARPGTAPQQEQRSASESPGSC